VMDPDFHVRPYLPGDEKEIVDLLNHAYNGWPKIDLKCSSLDHWKWKYQENPLKNGLIVVATHDQKIIGCHHDIPLTIKIGSDIHRCTYTADLAVSRNHRDKGVSTTMRRYKEKNLKINEKMSYFVTGNPKLLKKFTEIFHEFPEKIRNYAWIKDIELQLENIPVRHPFLIKYGFKISKYYNKLINSFFNKNNNSNEFTVKTIKKFDERINALMNKVNEDYDFIVKRDKNYLNWKYADIRSGNFVINQIEDREQILGYVVLSINKYLEKYSIGYIVDLITVPNNDQVFGSLIKNAMKYFADNNVNIINFLIVKNHFYEELVKKNGFLYSRKNLDLFYQEFDEKNDLMKKNKFFVSWGDLDVLPVETRRET
jgi:hypothetical protein